MSLMVLELLQMDGDQLAELPPGQGIDKAGLSYPFMPPFVGTYEEMEALVAYLASIAPATPEAPEGDA